jgi:hypothetical protein
MPLFKCIYYLQSEYPFDDVEIELEDESGCVMLEEQDIGHTSKPWTWTGPLFLLFILFRELL